jgi:hypothetical protein
MKDIILITELIVIRNQNKLKAVARQMLVFKQEEGMASSNGRIRSSRMFYSVRCPRGQIMKLYLWFISILNSLTPKKRKGKKKSVSRPSSTRNYYVHGSLSTNAENTPVFHSCTRPKSLLATGQHNGINFAQT